MSNIRDVQEKIQKQLDEINIEAAHLRDVLNEQLDGVLQRRRRLRLV